MICWAIARWQLIASAVTMVPFRESISSSFGTAVISFDLAPAFAGAGSGGERTPKAAPRFAPVQGVARSPRH
jgi:hypothetical protein